VSGVSRGPSQGILMRLVAESKPSEGV